jgi:hypothetical protein
VPVAIGLDGRSGYTGRPTILVDGEGLFPVEEHPGARAVSCRIPSTSEGQNHPTAAVVREALARRFTKFTKK